MGALPNVVQSLNSDTNWFQFASTWVTKETMLLLKQLT